MISVISGVVVIIFSILGLSSIPSNIEPYVKWILIILSAGFIMCDIYILFNHIKKHININNIINKNMEE